MKSHSFVFLLCLFSMTAQSELPLVQDTSLVLPGNSGWDIEYWMSDNSLGWATLIGDTVRYVTEVGQPVQSLVIPDSIFETIEYFEYGPYHERVYLCRTIETGNDPCVVVLSRVSFGDYDYYDRHVVHGWDLATQELLFLNDFGGAVSQDNGGSYYSTSSSVGSFILWPPPPQRSQWLIFGQYLVTLGYTMGDNWWGDSRGATRLLDLTTDSLSIVDSSSTVLPFRVEDTLHVALAGYSSEWYNDDEWSVSWIRTYVVGVGTSAPYLGSGLRVAQSDADGIPRLILGSSALDANDYTELWHNDVMAEPTVAFRPTVNGNEVLLSYHNQLHAFFAYDAATGLLIDNTSSIEGGAPRYVLQAPGRADALVTFVDSTRLARIYRLGEPPAPEGLTCYWVPSSEVIRLNWEPVSFADRYFVYAEMSTGEDSLIADVAAPEHMVEFLPAANRQTFYVKAIRD